MTVRFLPCVADLGSLLSACVCNICRGAPRRKLSWGNFLQGAPAMERLGLHDRLNVRVAAVILARW